MSNPLRALPTTPGSPNDVIRRVVKAWMGAYDMTHAEFADAIGVNQRTFERRLAGSGTGRTFTLAEVTAIAALIAAAQGQPVTVDDMYSGKVNVGRPRERDPVPFGSAGSIQERNGDHRTVPSVGFRSPFTANNDDYSLRRVAA